MAALQVRFKGAPPIHCVPTSHMIYLNAQWEQGESRGHTLARVMFCSNESTLGPLDDDKNVHKYGKDLLRRRRGGIDLVQRLDCI